MEYQLIDGKATATAIKQEIAAEVSDIVARGGKQPHLAAVLVGHDGGSALFVHYRAVERRVGEEWRSRWRPDD